MSYLQENTRRAVTVPRLQEMRAAGEKIAMLTCYDASFAGLLERAGVDTVLIGDSLGNVVQGHRTTLPVSIDDMAYHTACVARGCTLPLIITDLPFGSVSTAEATYAAAVQLMKAGAQMVKLEGGEWLAPIVKFLIDRAIPVCAHIGLTPQSVHAFGGFKVQGRSERQAEQLKADARALADAGAQLLLMEAVPAALAAEITRAAPVPTIGIGAGVDCSGQVLVLHDMLGIFPGKRPRFARNFMDGQPDIITAVGAYVKAVKDLSFPDATHTF
ncbi:MAG: 3-methyl-2-oxobutanoate hydroxymethyltransferase [Janthinobacterium lividum]